LKKGHIKAKSRNKEIRGEIAKIKEIDDKDEIDHKDTYFDEV